MILIAMDSHLPPSGVILIHLKVKLRFFEFIQKKKKKKKKIWI